MRLILALLLLFAIALPADACGSGTNRSGRVGLRARMTARTRTVVRAPVARVGVFRIGTAVQATSGCASGACAMPQKR